MLGYEGTTATQLKVGPVGVQRMAAFLNYLQISVKTVRVWVEWRGELDQTCTRPSVFLGTHSTCNETYGTILVSLWSQHFFYRKDMRYLNLSVFSMKRNVWIDLCQPSPLNICLFLSYWMYFHSSNEIVLQLHKPLNNWDISSPIKRQPTG